MQEAWCTAEAVPLPITDRLLRLGQHHPLLTAISNCGQYGWQVCSSALEVFSLPGAQRLAAWNFGSTLKDVTTRITAVAEFSKMYLLVASYNETAETSLLCAFDVNLSQVVHAVEMPYMVTSVSVVSRSPSCHSPLLASQLADFQGVVAVGCHTGRVLLLDLCNDELPTSDETCPYHTEKLGSHPTSVQRLRQMALSRQAHISLHLTEGNHMDGTFYYRKPDGSAVLSYSEDDVCVSCMEYIPQTGQLAVGLSIGCFLLYSLSSARLEYSSRHLSDQMPITQFAFQEPENDPRNFCYLWVVHSSSVDSEREIGDSTATLFQMGFVHKNWYEGLGSVYKELISVGPRFEHQLGVEPYNGESGGESRVLSCYTLANTHSSSHSASSDLSTEEGSGVDLSLCVIVWEAFVLEGKNPVYLAVFDMNRWYHAQMPTSVRLYSNQCSYLTVCGLNTGLPTGTTDIIKAAYVGHLHSSRFQSPYIPPPEQTFHPSALALEVCVVTSSSVVQARFLGRQRQILSELVHRGPSCLLEIDSLYEVCLHAGLLPRSADIGSLMLTQSKKREALLTMAVDHGLTSFIMATINTWSSTEFVRHGCTMRMLFEWAWDKVARIKDDVDRLCVCLYDWSGVSLDQQSLQILHHNQTCLSNMVTVFETLASLESNITQKGRGELDSRLCVVTLLHDHLDMVLGFYMMGLLPEQPAEDDTEECFPFPSKAIQDAYVQRRHQISQLHRDVESHHVLLIDGLMKECNEVLKKIWGSEEHGHLYPPSSFHAVLSLYLVQDLSMAEKHLLVYYVFCDLLALTPESSQQKMNEKLHQFSQVCRLPASVNKLVQGIWLLDHREFQDALVYLLDPVVQDQVLPWQHRCIMKAFVYQGHSALALKYLRVRQPPVLCEEDIKLRLTVLLANELTWEAVDYQRRCRDQANAADLLSHLLTASQQTGTVERLLQLPWTRAEEKLLLECLGEKSGGADSSHRELLVMYFLQRARFTEAARQNTKITGSLDVISRDRARVRNAIVEGYQRVLPAVQRKLTHTAGPLRPARGRCQVVCPKPLSTTVYSASSKTAVTRAFLLGAVLDKVREVKVENLMMEESASIDERMEDEADDIEPFVGTPRVPKNKSVIESLSNEMVFATPTKVTQVTRPAPSSVKVHESAAVSHSPSLNKINQRRSHLMSSEALLLLRTPPVIRRPRPSRVETKSLMDIDDSLFTEKVASSNKERPLLEYLQRDSTSHSALDEPGTPRPILKGSGTPRSILKEGSTPLSVKENSTPKSILKGSTPSKLPQETSLRGEEVLARNPLARSRDFSSLDIVWPTPPVPTRISQMPLLTADDTDASHVVFTFDTPKQLRFVEPEGDNPVADDDDAVSSQDSEASLVKTPSLLASLRRASSRHAQQKNLESESSAIESDTIASSSITTLQFSATSVDTKSRELDQVRETSVSLLSTADISTQLISTEAGPSGVVPAIQLGKKAIPSEAESINDSPTEVVPTDYLPTEVELTKATTTEISLSDTTSTITSETEALFQEEQRSQQEELRSQQEQRSQQEEQRSQQEERSQQEQRSQQEEQRSQQEEERSQQEKRSQQEERSQQEQRSQQGCLEPEEMEYTDSNEEAGASENLNQSNVAHPADADLSEKTRHEDEAVEMMDDDDGGENLALFLNATAEEEQNAEALSTDLQDKKERNVELLHPLPETQDLEENLSEKDVHEGSDDGAHAEDADRVEDTTDDFLSDNKPHTLLTLKDLTHSPGKKFSKIGSFQNQQEKVENEASSVRDESSRTGCQYADSANSDRVSIASDTLTSQADDEAHLLANSSILPTEASEICDKNDVNISVCQTENLGVEKKKDSIFQTEMIVEEKISSEKPVEAEITVSLDDSVAQSDVNSPVNADKRQPVLLSPVEEQEESDVDTPDQAESVVVEETPVCPLTPQRGATPRKPASVRQSTPSRRSQRLQHQAEQQEQSSPRRSARLANTPQTPSSSQKNTRSPAKKTPTARRLLASQHSPPKTTDETNKPAPATPRAGPRSAATPRSSKSTNRAPRGRRSLRSRSALNKDEVEMALQATAQIPEISAQSAEKIISSSEIGAPADENQDISSRDASPDVHQTSDTESAMGDEIFRSSADFIFSEPMMVDDAPEKGVTADGKVKSFIFSPPITRGRAQRESLDLLTPVDLRRQSLESRRLSAEGKIETPSTPRRRSLAKKTVVATDSDLSSSPAKNTRSALLKKSHNIRSARSPADSVNLLAPVPEEETNSTSPVSHGSSRGAQQQPAASRPVTRSRRRKTLKW